MIDRIEQAIVTCPPAVRRRIAIHMLIWSVVAMVANVAAYVTGLIGQRELILITLILSWLAITITAADLVATTDVREAEELSDTAELSDAADIEVDVPATSVTEAIPLPSPRR
jgi:hypothetical protein